MGFLHSTTENGKEPRIKTLQRAKRPLGMPDLGEDSYLLQALIDAGPVQHTSWGPQPLAWADLLAFGQATLAVTEPWEFRALARMSLAYLQELQLGKDALTMPPVERASDPEEPDD